VKIVFLPGYRFPSNSHEPIICGDLRQSYVLSCALAKLGHEVWVISRRAKDDRALTCRNGVHIIRYKSRLTKLFSTSFDVSFRRYSLFNSLQKKADLIVCNSALSLEHFTKIRAPMVYVASGLEDIKNYAFSFSELVNLLAIKLLRDPLKRLTWRRSQFVNTTAWHEDQKLIKWGLAKEKILKISSAVNQNHFYPRGAAQRNLRIKLSLAPHEKIVLSVSRFTPAKGVIETIQAFDLLNHGNAKLLLVGVQHSHSNSYYQDVLNTIASAKHKDQIILLKNVAETELPFFYSMANVTSVFSKGYDPLPTVIIESMACGTPVVATYYKTREQFISDGQTGVFVPEKDIAQWARVVRDLIDNEGARQKMSRKALEYVSANFNDVDIAKRFLAQIGSRLS